MINCCKCEYNECIHSQECKRYNESIGEVMNFKVICKEENNYEWLYKTEDSITESEETNNIK